MRIVEDPVTGEQYMEIKWYPEDVRSQFDEYALTEEDSLGILERCVEYYDCNVGINWEVIQIHGDDYLDAHYGKDMWPLKNEGETSINSL